MLHCNFFNKYCIYQAKIGKCPKVYSLHILASNCSHMINIGYYPNTTKKNYYRSRKFNFICSAIESISKSHLVELFYLNTLSRQGRISNGYIGIWLIEVEAVEVQPEEADVLLALANVDAAWARWARGLAPVSQVLAVGASTISQKVTANSKASCTCTPSCSSL